MNMNLDSHGLPVQSNGDANDQLNRCGLIAVAGQIDKDLPREHYWLWFSCIATLVGSHQVKPGVYVRYVGGNANNVSADQLLPVLCAWICLRDWSQAGLMFIRMVNRLGFAQNYTDGIEAASNVNSVSRKIETNVEKEPQSGLSGERWKLPDFMALRALPLFARTHWSLYPVALVADLFLVFAALASCGPVWRDDRGFTKRSPDDVDDGVLICTLATCRAIMPTPLSWLACKLYGRLRPWNYGCNGGVEYVNSSVGTTFVTYRPVFGSLRWYFRAESGGSPEIAELWKPICERYFE